MAAVSLAGCGHGMAETEGRVAAANRSERPSRALHLASPAISEDGSISPRLKCHAGRAWVPLEWRRAPSGTTELILYIGRYVTKVEANRAVLTVPSASIVLGIDPKARGISMGDWPEGVREISYRPRYGCPSKSGDGNFLFRVFAMSAGGQVTPAEIDASILVRLEHDALGEGHLRATY
jgi:hypothetical protein